MEASGTNRLTILASPESPIDSEMIRTRRAGNARRGTAWTHSNAGSGLRHYVDNDTCLSCHGDSYEALAEQTADLEPYNPHDSPHGQLNCNECHKGHAQQVDTCGQCHPNGGQTMRGTN